MFWFEKPGHVTKKVQFNTAVPESVTSDPEFIPFPDFDFYVTLFKTYPEVDTMFFTKPVGKIQYSAEKNDFDWDKNYTLEIQRRMEEIEEEIRQKHEDKLKQEQEAIEQAKEQEIRAEEERREAEKQAQIEKERQEKEAKEREKEAKKIADAEEERRKQEEKDREKTEREAAKQAEEEAKVKQSQNEEEPKLVQNNQEEPKVEIPEKPEKTEEPQSKKETDTAQNIVTEEKAPIVKTTKEIEGELYKPNTKPSYGRTVTSNTKPVVKQIDKVEIAGRTTTKTKITENNTTLTYVKVEYTWGGRFFFIEDEPGIFRNISEQYYIRKVKNNKN